MACLRLFSCRMIRFSCSVLLLTSLFVGFAAADGGDDFANNLFSDLAPILALFGERVTMQFLSQSMGWADCILLAMAPLGIITTIISAVRVGGPSWLKAVVGRSTENLSTAEMELMSSTSDEVCELWNGKDIVRCQGSPSIWEFICVMPEGISSVNEGLYQKVRVVQLTDTLEKENAQPTPGRSSRPPDEEASFPPAPPKPDQKPQVISQCDDKCITITRNTEGDAPNITLNRPKRAGRAELRFFACMGILIQLCVIFYFGVITYTPSFKLKKDNRPVTSYAFPLTGGGTVLLVLGMLICAHVVDSSTGEKRYKLPEGKKAQMVWLQKRNKVSDQVFSAVAIHRGTPCEMITTSNRVVKDSRDTKPNAAASVPETSDNQPLVPLARRCQGEGTESQGSAKSSTERTPTKLPIEAKTVIGVLICVSGFFIQFIGLRSMHWSASVAQLGAVLTMTVTRTWVRRNFTHPVTAQEVTSEHELDWFAWSLTDLTQASWSKTLLFQGKAKGSGCSARHRVSALRKRFLEFLSGKSPDTKVAERAGVWAVLNVGGKGRDTSISQEDSGSRSPPNAHGQVPNTKVPYLETQERCTAPGILTLRAQLTKLGNWGGPTSAEAVCLSAAMEVVLNELWPPEGNSRMHRRHTWQLPVSYSLPDESKIESGTTEVVRVELNCDNGAGTWKVQAHEIDAVLSLSLYSKKRQQANETQRGDPSDPPSTDTWLREKRAPNPAYRELGPHASDLVQDLQWWMPSEGFNALLSVPASTKDRERLSGVIGDRMGRATFGKRRFLFQNPRNDKREHLSSSDEHAFDLGDESFLLSASDLYKSNPVKYSVAYERRNADNGSDLEQESDLDDKMNKDEESRREAERHRHEEGHPDGENVSDQENRRVLVVESREAQEKALALDLFSVFMWAVSKQDPKPLDKDSKLQLAGGDHEVWKSFTLQSKRLSRLAQRIQGTGLMGLHDAYLSVIVPFSMQERLPELGAITKHVSAQGRELEKQLKWEEAGDAYAWLLSIARRFPSQKQMYIKAAAISTQYLKARSPGRKFRAFQAWGDNYDCLPMVERTEQRGEKHVRNLLNSPPPKWRPQESRELRSGLQRFGTIREGLNGGHGSEQASLLGIPSSKKLRSRDVMGRSWLHYASGRGDKKQDEEMVSEYVRERLSINIRDDRNLTPLHFACHNGHDNMVRVLLAKGAKVDAQTVNGSSPLHFAALNGHDEIARRLIRNDAPRRLRDDYGRLPIHCSAINGHVSLVQRLSDDADVKDHQGRTVLHYAAWFGRGKLVEEILGWDRHTTPSLESVDEHGCTALHLAAEKGHSNVVKMLVAAQANIEATCRLWKSTPLHLAAARGQIAVVILLVESSPESRLIWDANGRTPMGVANDYKQLVVRDYLERWRSDESDSQVTNSE